MAQQLGVWGIDIGQCALKAIKLRYDSKKERVIAEAFDYVEHPKILSQPDADPEELIGAALEKFLSRNEVADHNILISVPGQAGLSRFVKLPPVETKKIPEIVNFEARQQIPFPLEEVVWDYQQVGSAESEEEDEQDEVEGFALEMEVAIFAIKRDMVERHLAPLQSAGIEVKTIQLAPIALYNFLAYDYFWSQVQKKQAEEGEEQTAEESEEEGETIVILDMGADKSDVVISDGDTIWLRNLPIGGNHFTRALTKELNLTFAKAEHLKRNLMKAPDSKKLYQAMRPVFNQFVNELQRSIGYFSSTHRDHTIRKVIGVGNGFKLPGLQKYLQQNLQHKTEKLIEFHGLTGDETLGSAAFSQNLLSFCVAYGLALQGVGQSPIQTNLLPPEIRQARLIRAKKPWLLTAASLLLLGSMILFYGNFLVYRTVHAENFAGPVSSAEEHTQRFGQWQRDYDHKKQELFDMLGEAKQLLCLDKEHYRRGWIDVLKLINETSLPERNLGDAEDPTKIAEVHIEHINAVFLSDVVEWIDGQPPRAKNTLKAKEKPDEANGQPPPSGEGWVFQILGYTHNQGKELYVLREVLDRFQKSKELQEAGISHALLYWSTVDDKWTPVKTSSLLARPPLATQLDKSLESQWDEDEKNDEEDRADTGMGRKRTHLARDFEERDQAGWNKGERNMVTTIRTDFDIQFLWRPYNPDEGTPEETP